MHIKTFHSCLIFTLPFQNDNKSLIKNLFLFMGKGEVRLGGVLKFLKRDKSKELDMDFDNFDVPPIPPEPQGMEGKDFETFPELPELAGIDEPAPEMEEEKKPISGIKIPLQQTMGMDDAVLQQPESFKPIEDIKADF